MAGKVKRRRRETKRVRLGKALRAELAPLMKSHGFRNAPEHWERILSPTPADTWARVRGPYTDVIHIYWRRYGAPKFAIAARTDEPGRLSDVHAFAWVVGGFPGHVFGGWLRFIRPTVRRAARRMVLLIRYLETGEKSRYVG